MLWYALWRRCRNVEAFPVANDLQVDGAVRARDALFALDTTPVANRVDGRQIDGGDMVNVILQALEIRLGHGGSRDNNDDDDNGSGGDGDDDEQRQRRGGGGGGGSPLSVIQTSAAMMASDFILDKLELIAEEYPGDARAPVLYVEATANNFIQRAELTLEFKISIEL